MMSKTPEEASSDMRQFARMCRDLYVALIAEGFTPQEAQEIIGMVLLSNGKP